MNEPTHYIYVPQLLFIGESRHLSLSMKRVDYGNESTGTIHFLNNTKSKQINIQITHIHKHIEFQPIRRAFADLSPQLIYKS